jgi:inosine/xanthosine triphosphate pyrophosphatase family protein
VTAPTLLLATLNSDKQSRLAWVVEGLGFDLVRPRSAEGVAADEAGTTHRAIAATKARRWSGTFDGLVVASDGGVLVPALGDSWTSVRTRRATGQSNDATRVADLIERLQDRRGNQRAAFRVEALAVAERGELLGVWQARGPRLLVAEQPRGCRPEGGFWLEVLLYDPISGRTLAELSAAERDLLDGAWRGVRSPARRLLLARKAQRQ